VTFNPHTPARFPAPTQNRPALIYGNWIDPSRAQGRNALFDLHEAVEVYDRAMGTALRHRLPNTLDVDRDLQSHSTPDHDIESPTDPSAAAALPSFLHSDCVVLVVATAAAYASDAHVRWLADMVDRFDPTLFVWVSSYRLLTRPDSNILRDAFERSSTWVLDRYDVLVPDPHSDGMIQLAPEDVARPSAANRTRLIWSANGRLRGW
jgi:hypothetical protein